MLNNCRLPLVSGTIIPFLKRCPWIWFACSLCSPDLYASTQQGPEPQQGQKLQQAIQADLSRVNTHGVSVVNASGMASRWRFDQGNLLQSNFVGNFGPALTGGYAQGTYAYLALLDGLTDYTYRAVISPSASSGETLGILFHYQDQDNYFRLLTSYAQGYTRLEKRVAGKFTTLAQNARGYPLDQTLEFVATSQRGTMQLSINGEKLFSAQDRTLLAGSVGVFTRDAITVQSLTVAEPDQTPAVFFVKPTDHFVSSGSGLPVEVTVRNAPADSRVEIKINGHSCAVIQLSKDVPSTSGALRTNCEDPARFDSSVTVVRLSAELKDTKGAVLDSHRLSNIAINGTQILTIGDSITWGEGDEYSADGTVQGGWRIARQGYQTNLIQRLNKSAAVVHQAFNEAVRGDRTAVVANERLADYLDRHPTARQVILLLGTNDAQRPSPTASGYGLNCEAGDCENTYKGALRDILKQLAQAELKTMIVQLPPRFGDWQGPPYDEPAQHEENTESIQIFNAIIRGEDPFPLAGYELGPDLYELLLSSSHNRFDLMHDNLHLNGLGTHLMATAIHNALTGGDDLPFTLNSLCVRIENRCTNPIPYKQNLIEPGDQLYVDAPTRLVGQIPDALTEGRWINTADAHRTQENDDYLSFVLNRSASVYVAYDAAAELPAWLAPWRDTGDLLETDSATAPRLRLLAKDVVVTDGSEKVVLPGAASGSTGAATNYVVIVAELTSSSSDHPDHTLIDEPFPQ